MVAESWELRYWHLDTMITEALLTVGIEVEG